MTKALCKTFTKYKFLNLVRESRFNRIFIYFYNANLDCNKNFLILSIRLLASLVTATVNGTHCLLQSKLPFSVFFYIVWKFIFVLIFSPYTRQIGGNASLKHTEHVIMAEQSEASQLSVNCWLYRAHQVSTSNGKRKASKWPTAKVPKWWTSVNEWRGVKGWLSCRLSIDPSVHYRLSFGELQQTDTTAWTSVELKFIVLLVCYNCIRWFLQCHWNWNCTGQMMASGETKGALWMKHSENVWLASA